MDARLYATAGRPVRLSSAAGRAAGRGRGPLPCRGVAGHDHHVVVARSNGRRQHRLGPTVAAGPEGPAAHPVAVRADAPELVRRALRVGSPRARSRTRVPAGTSATQAVPAAVEPAPTGARLRAGVGVRVVLRRRRPASTSARTIARGARGRQPRPRRGSVRRRPAPARRRARRRSRAKRSSTASSTLGESVGGGTSVGSIRSSRARQPAQRARLRPAVGALGDVTAHLVHLRRVERAEHVAAQQRAVGRARPHARDLHLVEDQAQRAQGVGGAALDRAERDALALRDLAQAEAAVVRQPDHLAVLRREPGERGRHLPAQHRLLELTVDLGRALGLGLRGQPGPHRGAPARVHDPVAGDRVQPGAHARPASGRSRCGAPCTGEDVLHHLLGEFAVAEGVAGEAEQLARVAAVQLPQLVTAVVTRQSLHERCIARGHALTLYATERCAVRSGATQQDQSEAERVAPPGIVRRRRAAAARSRSGSPPWRSALSTCVHSYRSQSRSLATHDQRRDQAGGHGGGEQPLVRRQLVGGRSPQRVQVLGGGRAPPVALAEQQLAALGHEVAQAPQDLREPAQRVARGDADDQVERAGAGAPRRPAGRGRERRAGPARSARRRRRSRRRARSQRAATRRSTSA